PEPPLLKRIDAFLARSSQASVRSKSYFFFSRARGGSLSSHIPSSAWIFFTDSPTSSSTNRITAHRMKDSAVSQRFAEAPRTDRHLLQFPRAPSPCSLAETRRRGVRALPSGPERSL